MDVLYRAGGPWRNLTASLVSHTAQGCEVGWVSTSGTLLVFATGIGGLTRRRVNPHALHAWAHLPLIWQEPSFATACGCGDGSGYRSTPALLVVAFDAQAELETLVAEAVSTADQLVAEGHDFLAAPPDHPAAPCAAMYCPLITPEAVASGA